MESGASETGGPETGASKLRPEIGNDGGGSDQRFDVGPPERSAVSPQRRDIDPSDIGGGTDGRREGGASDRGRDDALWEGASGGTDGLRPLCGLSLFSSGQPCRSSR
jgi:hypothetical protein